MSTQAPVPPPPAARTRLGPLRLVFAIIGGLIMLVSGGCSLALLPAALRASGGGELYIDQYTVVVFGGLPFLVGLSILLLALKAGR